MAPAEGAFGLARVGRKRIRQAEGAALEAAADVDTHTEVFAAAVAELVS
jgi:hypothetical protein